ncbi:4-oxalocrotonate tautomerase [Povalibacter uvarum]|uniref:4-oxalocrotonate tautomerase n=1 Tax=Povalibacter uvarum TaxID=732238 RepID=A0A841HMB9_9GAMM|nr:tautomerase family protein [Povalibacter uvarum]MBB6093893.1 4-oxalocrotonate tautomerase [Povalibacter uvarum]
MPHVIVKLWPGKTEEQKSRLTEAIVRDLMTVMGSTEASISVAIEDVESAAWAEAVYKPQIVGNADKLYKKPGYEMS